MENLVAKKQFDIYSLKEQFIDFIDVSYNTVETYMNGIDNFARYINSKNIKNPQRKDIIEWRDITKEECSCSTANTYLVAIKAFFNFLEMNNLYYNITKNVKGFKMSDTPRKSVLTLEQTKTIYKGLTDLREKALFSLLITTGLRGTEIANAKIEDIKEYNGEICLFVKCKGHNDYDEYVKLSEDVLNNIKEYIGQRNCGYIFISNSNHNKNGGITIKTVREIIKGIFNRFGLNDETLSLHSTRRTFACISYGLGKSIYDIKEVLHHSSIITTQRYLKQADRTENNTENLVANAIMG